MSDTAMRNAAGASAGAGTGVGLPGWSRTFPAVAEQVPEARRYLADLLRGHRAAADAIACLDEVAANAVQHSRSARPGGTFTVRVRRAGGAIRVEVADDGGPWAEWQDDDPEHGRGLMIVSALAREHGVITQGPPAVPDHRVCWFDIDLRPPR